MRSSTFCHRVRGAGETALSRSYTHVSTWSNRRGGGRAAADAGDIRSLTEAHGGAGAAGQIGGGKAGGGEPAGDAVLVLAELELDIARAQGRGAAPGQRLVGALDHLAVGVDRLGETVEPARLAGHIGFEALARLDAVPAAGEDSALVLDAERRHHGVGGLVAPGEADALSLLHRMHQDVEEGRRPRGIARQAAVLEELRQRGLGLLAFDAVDRVGVVAAEDEKPLDAGQARLLGRVVVFLAEAGGETLLALGRLHLGETDEPLLRLGAVARAGDQEGPFGDAQVR